MKNLILLRNNLVEIKYPSTKTQLSKNILGTILSNLVYYGYVPSGELYYHLSNISKDDAKEFWSNLEPVLKQITGSNKKMDNYVVYKNFPKEVLEMSYAQYWISQILMYIGLPNELFTQNEIDRDQMFEEIEFKVLHMSNSNSLRNICNSLIENPSRWTKEQFDFVKYLIINEGIICDIASIPFKENMAELVAELIKNDVCVNIKSATDVLRLAIGMSNGDVSMRTQSKFRSFSRKERRFLLNLLENSTALEDDMARRKNKWKKFMKVLHPGDYAKSYPSVSKAYDCLYNNNFSTFNSKIELMYLDFEEDVLNLLQKRPGEFTRRLHQMIDKFGQKAVVKFNEVLSELSIIQLLKISKYIETINDRNKRIFPPKGNWAKIQIVDNDRKINKAMQKELLTKINAEVAKRIKQSFSTVNLSDSAKMVKIQTNDSELTSYGRGTVFPIPENIKFIRTANYWQTLGYGHNIWFDNSWNFFDSNWNDVGACCWTNMKLNDLNKTLAVFSGDPTNSKEMEGKACQMIDLYLDELEESKVSYAVWNILCYSHISFKQADDVYAAMQWGEDPQKGKLFEPSRCQLSFQIDGDSLT